MLVQAGPTFGADVACRRHPVLRPPGGTIALLQ